MGIIVRGYCPTDLPGLCALVGAADRRDCGDRSLPAIPDAGAPVFLFAPRYPLGPERGITPEEVWERLGGVLARVSCHVLVAVDRGDHLVGCVSIYPMEGGPAPTWSLELMVDPDRRTDEIGHLLLSSAFAQARRLSDGEGRIGRLPLEARGSAGDRCVQGLLQGAGLIPVRTFAILERSTGPGEEEAWECASAIPGIRIRGYEAKDAPSWVSALNAAFATHWGGLSYTLEKWDRHVRSPRFRAALSLVAMAGEDMVGICHATPGLAQEPPREAHLHLLGVRPGYQRRGLGRLLLKESLLRLAQAGIGRVELDVDGENPTALRLYHSLGFRQREAITIFQGEI